ncbi:MAG: hypothetical protein JXR70_19345 [Spirochaetales bacterium]|nr:hypothetical protein [Spirochaetales bacterium]
MASDKSWQLLTLLHFSDSAFPTGAFGHSFGLEYAITMKWIKGLEDLLEFSKEVLYHSLIKGEAIFILLAYEAAKKNDLQKIHLLDDISRLYRPSHQSREASAQIGRSLVSLVADVYKIEFLDTIKNYIYSELENQPIQHGVAWGVVGGCLDIESSDILISFLSGFFRQWAQVAVRILPLGQRESQIYIKEMNEMIFLEMSCLAGQVSLDMVSQCSLGYDMAQMGHESLKARYFRS